MAPSISSPVFLASFAVPSSSKSAAASSKGKHVKVASVQPLKGKGKKVAGSNVEEVAVGVDGEGIWRYDVSSIFILLEGIKANGVEERGGARGKLRKENLLRSTFLLSGAPSTLPDFLVPSFCSGSYVKCILIRYWC